MTRAGRVVLVATLVVGLGCAKARHVAVVADAAVASAVFALDDALTEACRTGALAPDPCGRVNAPMVAALREVKAVTAALQATPRAAAVPVSLPDLLAALVTIQGIVAPFTTDGTPAADIARRLDTALAQSVGLVRAFAGGPR